MSGVTGGRTRESGKRGKCMARACLRGPTAKDTKGLTLRTKRASTGGSIARRRYTKATGKREAPTAKGRSSKGTRCYTSFGSRAR